MSMNEVDIASFAESMLTERMETGKPVQFSAPQAPNAPDVSDIEVPHDFTSQILNEGHWDKAEIDVVNAPAPPKAIRGGSVLSEEVKIRGGSVLSEEVKIRKALFEQYRTKLEELDEIVKEMTTVGMTSMGGSAPESTSSQSRKKNKNLRGRTRRSNN